MADVNIDVGLEHEEDAASDVGDDEGSSKASASSERVKR